MKRFVLLLLAIGLAATLAAPALAVDITPHSEKQVQSAQQRVAQVLAEPRYLSTGPAKQSWPMAYAGFYNAWDTIKTITASEEISAVVQPREGFAYSLFRLGETMNSGKAAEEDANRLAFGNLLTDPTLTRERFLSLCRPDKDDVGLLVDYVGTNNFYGEATVVDFGPKRGWRLHNVWQCEPGQYTNGRSLTMIEGLENQLLDLGFSPKTTTAFSLSIAYFGQGIAFVDGERFCFVLKRAYLLDISDENTELPATGVALSLRQVGQYIIDITNLRIYQDSIPPPTRNIVSADAQQIERRAQLVMANSKMTSAAPAKQVWAMAYASFYNGRVWLEQQGKGGLMPGVLASGDMPVKVRGDFVFPIYKLYAEQGKEATVLCDVFNAMLAPGYNAKNVVNDPPWWVYEVGTLVDYAEPPAGTTDPFFGEATFRYDKRRDEGGQGWYQYSSAVQFGVGKYNGRISLTMTEGLENQLLAMGFAPATTTAFAAEMGDFGRGTWFLDGEKAAYYRQSPESSSMIHIPLNNEIAPCNVLYTPAELGVIWQEIQPPSDMLPPISPANPGTGKPVIYLYPQAPTEVAVKLGYPAESLTYTYPAYNGGWTVTAYPDGRLVNKADGGEHYYLFWEGDKAVDWDFSSGFVVPGGETEAFLREKLPLLGLLPREYNDFITYWVPRMQDAPYNLISFKTEQYEALAPLDITPAPDSVLRVHMSFKPLSKRVEIPSQTLPVPPAREGFTVVEWGGSHN